ncbi:MAG TPA: class I SAM-dependent methyltransferase [Chloroflexota bacterium]|jgi:SAM-dependent methyltransferase|nr:class I SAM-dependent methyltransferase [Chloroflexota bacterium]
MAEPPPEELAAFRALEHQAWETVVGCYAEGFGPLTCQLVEPLLDAVHAGPGTRLLDVACGPGYVAAAAAARGARARGVDFAAAMVALARARYPQVAFAVGDAEALDFPDAQFDAVTCNFGVLHLARPQQALAEAYRVLAPGGWYGFTVWASPEHAVGFQLVLRAVEQYGNPHVPLPQGPPFFRYSEPAVARGALEAVGFVECCARVVPLVWHLPTADALFTIMAQGTARTAALLRAQTPAAREAIAAALRAALVPYASGPGYAVPMAAMLAAGRRPG